MPFIVAAGATLASAAFPPGMLSGNLGDEMNHIVVAELDMKPVTAARLRTAVFPGFVGLVIHRHSAIVELHDACNTLSAEQTEKPPRGGLSEL